MLGVLLTHMVFFLFVLFNEIVFILLVIFILVLLWVSSEWLHILASLVRLFQFLWLLLVQLVVSWDYACLDNFVMITIVLEDKVVILGHWFLSHFLLFVSDHLVGFIRHWNVRNVWGSRIVFGVISLVVCEFIVLLLVIVETLVLDDQWFVRSLGLIRTYLLELCCRPLEFEIRLIRLWSSITLFRSLVAKLVLNFAVIQAGINHDSIFLLVGRLIKWLLLFVILNGLILFIVSHLLLHRTDLLHLLCHHWLAHFLLIRERLHVLVSTTHALFTL